MNFLFKTKPNIKRDEFAQLIQIIRNDSEINKRIVQLLKLNSYQRRNVLNRWLEHLRRNSASENLRYALSNLFDDDISKEIFKLINHNRI